MDRVEVSKAIAEDCVSGLADGIETRLRIAMLHDYEREMLGMLSYFELNRRRKIQDDAIKELGLTGYGL